VFKAVFLDWFNTLARYEPPQHEVHQQAFRQVGIDISPQDILRGVAVANKYLYEENFRLSLGKRDPRQRFEVYMRYEDIILSEAGVKVSGETLTRIMKKAEELFKGARFVLFDDVFLALKTLKKQNLILGLLTNLTKGVDSTLQKLGLESYLDFVVNPQEVGVDKPDPRFFLAALECAGVSASEAVHVGDQYEVDVVGARGVGISPILIDRYSLYPEVSDCPRISSLTEVVRYL